MKISGAEALLRGLENEGVDIVFGIPGGVLLPIYEALYDHKKIRHILMRHEQSAAHAADGYARATGKVGVCIATSGPGATNLVTGIANAYMDSIPIVAITGQVSSPVLGTDAFQEADITGITLPIVKHSYLIKDARDIPRVVREAFYIASTGRPGPVLIDIPKDMALAEIDGKIPEQLNLPGYKPTTKAHAGQIKNATKLIAASKQPILYCGGGVITAGASEALVALAETANIPVTTTLMGLGMIPGDHPLNLGMLGMHGTWYANNAISASDLIIALGVRFDDRVTGKLAEFAPNAKVIHADIDPAEIGKNIEARVPIVGSAEIVIKALTDEIKKVTGKKPLEHKPWLAQIDKWRKAHPLTYGKSDKILRPQFVVEQISKLSAAHDTIITTGVGQNQMWAAQFMKLKRSRTFISSGGLGTMGFGLPSAIGAQFGKPKSKVVTIDGDGSFQMVSQDMATAVMNKLPLNIAILNNGFLGMVRQWQELFHGHKYSASCMMQDYTCPPACSSPTEDCPRYRPDFVKLAEAYGAKGLRVTSPKDVAPAIKEALSSPAVFLIDFIISREEKVYPMVAPGAPITNMLENESE